MAVSIAELKAGAARASKESGIPSPSSAAECAALVDGYDNFLFDCDGVLWHAGHLLPRVTDVLQMLRDKKKRVFFVTNNSTSSRAMYQAKFAKLGIPCETKDIFPSSYAAAQYLATKAPHVKKAYVVGSAGLASEIESVGVTVVGAEQPEHNSVARVSEAAFSAIKVDKDIAAVVCGWDLGFSFWKLGYASLCLQLNKGCQFIATNDDPFDKLHDRNMPGNGCMIACIETSVARKANIVGKPSSFLVDLIVTANGLDKSRTCIVGDRLSTDIAFGVNGGIDSILVLTGVTSVDEACALRKPASAATATATATASGATGAGGGAGADEATSSSTATVSAPDSSVAPTVILGYLGQLAPPAAAAAASS